MKRLNTILRCILPLVGVVCIVIPGHVTSVLPYLLGGAMLVRGLAHAIAYIRSGEFIKKASMEMGQDVVLIVMGISFLCEGAGALGLMGITWGLIGLRKAAATIAQALRQALGRQKVLLTAFEALIRLTLALALLFDPFEKFPSHIVLLGLELILANIRLPREAALPSAEEH